MSETSLNSPANLDRSWAFCLLRLLAGINLFGHGAIRLLHGDGAFAQGMVHQMAGTPLPPSMVNTFGHAVPFVELTLGLMLIFAIFTRLALVSSLLFLSLLMVGITLLQDWPTAGLQLLYGLVFAALLAFRSDFDRGWFSLIAATRQSL